ncbi:MAG: phosphate signaling complex protein PhoU [Phycisphaeraceae bacterium]|nr:phosphate signaling complex protein PhoU [Phycisphaeraceae bacterium]
MTIHLQRQIDKLKDMILQLGAMVEGSVADAIAAARGRNETLAQKVIDHDQQIDLTEVEVEEECLHTLALHQPVAFDLRFVIAILKINNDLERIADLAVNIAEGTLSLSRHEPTQVPFDLGGMSEKVQQMLSLSLESLVSVDPEKAEAVRTADDEVDRIHEQMYQKVEEAIRQHPEQMAPLIRMMNVSKNLERIADLACNIAEDVLYMERGDIQRHRLHEDGA